MQKWFQEKISDAMVLDFAIVIYKEKFKSLIGYQILFLIVGTIALIAGGLILVPLMGFLSVSGIFSIVFFMLIIVLVAGCFIGLSQAGIFHIAYGYINGEDVRAGEALGRSFSSFKYIFRIVGAVVICLVPVFLILARIGFDTTTITLFQKNIEANPIISFYIEAFMFFFVSIFIGSYFFYSLHIAIFHKEKGFKSIKRSMDYARGDALRNIFRVMTISIFTWGINLSVYATVAAISGLIIFVLGKLQGGESLVAQIMLYSEVVRPYISFILGVILNAIGPIIWTVYYVNMKYKKEGLKIHNMIDSLEAKEFTGSPKQLDLNYE